MRRIGAILTWLLFMVALPLILTIVNCTPLKSVLGAKSNFLDSNWQILPVYVASSLLWLIWLYGLCMFVLDLWRLITRSSRRETDFAFRRWITISAAAVWSLVLASQASASTASGTTNETSAGESHYAKPRAEFEALDTSSFTPLALSTSTVLVSGVLQIVKSRRRAVLRGSLPHSQIQSISQRSQATLKELQLAESDSKCDDIRNAMESIIDSELSPILTSWRPGSTPCAVLQRDNQKQNARPLCCLPLGLSHGEIIFLSLSQGDVFSICPGGDDRARSVISHVAQAYVLETMGSDIQVFTLGFNNAELIGARNLTMANSVDQLTKSVLSDHSRHPIVVCSADPLSATIVNQLRGYGCAVVTASPDAEADVSLILADRGWTIAQIQLEISVYGISSEERTAVSRLVDEMSRPSSPPKRTQPITTASAWQVMVRMLGPVEVMTREGVTIRFEKSKSTELLAWLTTHRSRPSRSAARTALWEVSVQDATFTNVVSDVRRSLGRALKLADNEEWLGRTLTDSLPLHHLITTDYELLESSILRARSLDDESALSELCASLEYVRDLPFSGSNYLWSDSEGITTQLTLSVMTSAVMAARLFLERGDTQGVFWATGCGLKVLPGHEELLALRMRAHALKGDLAAVRAEWNSHERAIARDAWSGGATSPKLIELCRDLLNSPRQEAYSLNE